MSWSRRAGPETAHGERMPGGGDEAARHALTTSKPDDLQEFPGG